MGRNPKFDQVVLDNQKKNEADSRQTLENQADIIGRTCYNF